MSRWIIVKEVKCKQGRPEPGEYETVDNLQAAIDLAWGTTAHIHEGVVDPATGYPVEYYVCYGNCGATQSTNK